MSRDRNCTGGFARGQAALQPQQLHAYRVTQAREAAP